MNAASKSSKDEQPSAAGDAALVTRSTETVNGYALRDLTRAPEAWGGKGRYESLRSLWRPTPVDAKSGSAAPTTSALSRDQFWEAFEKLAWPLSWSNGAHGSLYGGYWLYSGAQLAKDADATKIRRTNADALYDLPYPKPFLLRMVELGIDCVDSANAIAVWFDRTAH